MADRSPHRRLVVIADVGTELFHVGDEAMLDANLAALRYREPGLEVTVIGRRAAGVAERLDVPALAAPPAVSLAEARLPPDIAAALDAADGVFLSGGGNLSSSWPELLGQRILLLREARRRGLPVVTGGQTIGPDFTSAERTAFAEVLAGVEQVGVRELPSAALALQMGVPPDRVIYQPDDAFLLAGLAPTASAAPVLPDGPFLAVTLDPSFAAPSSHGGLGSLAAQLARFAAESGLHLVFLPHVGPLAGPGGREDQAEEAEGGVGAALADLLRAHGTRCSLLPVMPPAETVWLTRQAALVVSSRYHPLVFATAAAVPCFGLHRDPYTRIKLQGALAHAGLADCCLPAAAAERGELLPALLRLWESRVEARAMMAAARPLLEAQEERRWRRLLACLGWQPPTEEWSEPAERSEPEALAAPGQPGEAPEVLGWPPGRLATAALGALALERQAGAAETGRVDSTVRHLERSVDLAVDRALRHRERLRGARCNIMEGSTMLTEQQWIDYARDGFLALGRVLEPEAVEALRQRADALALGEINNPQVQMQLDTGGAYEELPGAVSSFERGTVLYRKIQGLETDELFSRLVRHPLSLEVCARVYGRHAAISIFRAMVMNKPAGQGTVLPWHQDGGNVWALDRDPLVTIWVALDPATRANGCMEVIPGSHRLGLLSLFGSTVADDDVARHCPPESIRPLEVEAGHAVLLHNWLIHRSGVNPSPVPRRAFTACYMDGRTQSVLTGNTFPLVAGALPAEPYPFIRQMLDEMAQLRQMREESERYAKSLEAEREAKSLEAEREARNLEAERQNATRPPSLRQSVRQLLRRG